MARVWGLGFRAGSAAALPGSLGMRAIRSHSFLQHMGVALGQARCRWGDAEKSRMPLTWGSFGWLFGLSLLGFLYGL